MRFFFLIFASIYFLFSHGFSAYIKVTDFKSYLNKAKNFTFSDNQSLSPVEDSPQTPVFSYRFLDNQIKNYKNHNYVIHWNKGIFGQAPEFLGSDSRFHLLGWKTFFKKQNLSDFTISFYFFPKTIYSSESLIEGSEGISQIDEVVNTTFKVGLEHGNLVWEMNNFFHLKKEHLSLRLESNLPFKAQEWNHAVLTYDETNGRLIMYLNGEMVDFAYTTKSGRKNDAIYYGGFPNVKDIKDDYFILGKSFIGLLDEVEVFNYYLDNFTPRFEVATYKNKDIYSSIYASKVFKLEKGSQIEMVNFTGKNIDKKLLKIYLCNSKNYFTEKENFQECNQLLWEKIIIDYPKSQFYQFFLVYDNLDQSMKSIDSLTLTYQQDNAPLPPRWETVSQTKDGLLLEWRETLEKEIAGYHIYFKKDSFKGSKTIIELTKEDLEIYKTPFDRWTYILEDLEEDSLYFLAIKAYEFVDGKKRESAFSEIKSFYYISGFFN